MSDFTIIYGCMFSGKTTKLIELFNDSPCMPNEKIAVKPLIDNRYLAHSINSHDGVRLNGHRISKPEELYPLVNEQVKEVFIDEVQFMGKQIYDIILGLMIQDIRVVASGLDLDYLGRPFGDMPRIISLARNKMQLFAKCGICQKQADRTFRTVEDDNLMLVGHGDIYQARCKTHWEEGMQGMRSTG